MAQSSEHLLTGINPIQALLESSPEQVIRLYVYAQSKNPRVINLEDQARTAGIPVERSDRQALDKISEGERHQDVIAIFRPDNLYTEKDLNQLLGAISEAPLLLILDGITDPHNLGACLRSAEAAGVHLVIMPKDRSAGLTGVARKAASGAAEQIPLVYVTNLARVIKQLKKAGVWVAGTTDHGSQEIYEMDLSGPIALVMGSEGKGMRHLTESLCDYRIRIPMAGQVSSLNVSVATGVCLFEILRQRKKANG